MKKKWICTALLGLLLLAGCSTTGNQGDNENMPTETPATPTPTPFVPEVLGVFEAEEINDEQDRQDLVINMTEIVYPYLRAAVSALTANSFINPLMLPVIPAGTMFPEDRGETPANLN